MGDFLTHHPQFYFLIAVAFIKKPVFTEEAVVTYYCAGTGSSSESMRIAVMFQ